MIGADLSFLVEKLAEDHNIPLTDLHIEEAIIYGPHGLPLFGVTFDGEDFLIFRILHC